MKKILAFLKFYWKTLWIAVIIDLMIAYGGIIREWDFMVANYGTIGTIAMLAAVLGLLPLYGWLIYHFQWKPNNDQP
jgi:hypothetical protein